MATTTTTQTRTLWHHSDFLKLWASETISQFGTQFSGLAIPFTAVLLGAGAFEFSILFVTGTVAWPAFALFIGVWVDRHRRRPILASANVGRGILLAMIPLAAFTGVLVKIGMPLLYAISFFVGLLTVFFDISYQAYLPSLVNRDQLVEGNSKLEASRSTAQVVGPGIAGFVIDLVTAPIAVAVDALSYFGSASFLSWIRHDEPIAPKSGKNVWQDIREGLEVVFKDTRLRSIAGSTGTSNFFSSAMFAINIPYFVYQLHLTAGMLGVIFSIGSIGALLGVVLSSRIAGWIGVGPAIVLSMLVSGPGLATFYVASPSLSSVVLTAGPISLGANNAILMIGAFVTGISVVVYNINQVSLRQAIVPQRLQGRMNASMRWLVWGTIPLGGFAGGILGTFLGLRMAIGIGALGASLAFLWVLLSPVRSLKRIPEPLA